MKLKQKWYMSNDYNWKCCFYWLITWKLLFSVRGIKIWWVGSLLGRGVSKFLDGGRESPHPSSRENPAYHLGNRPNEIWDRDDWEGWQKSIWIQRKIWVWGINGFASTFFTVFNVYTLQLNALFNHSIIFPLLEHGKITIEWRLLYFIIYLIEASFSLIWIFARSKYHLIYTC